MTREQPAKNNPQLKTRKFGILKVEDPFIYWLEQRLDEAGRGVIMRWSEEGGLEEITKSPVSVRSRVHEYGGGDFCLGEGRVFYVSATDQQIYQCVPGGEPMKVTNAPDYRFADLEYDPVHKRIIAIAERHQKTTPPTPHPWPENMLVYIGLIDKEKGGLTVLSAEHNFYASPRLSPDGNTLAWLQWDLPYMPWETASLMTSPLDPKNFDPSRIAGGPSAVGGEDAACFGPVWSKQGNLYFISDEDGAGQLYQQEAGHVKKVAHQDSNTDSLRPLWVFGMQSLSVSEDNELFLTGFNNGEVTLQKITSKEITHIRSKAKSIEYQQCYRGQLAALVNTDETPASVALINPESAEITVIRSSAEGNVETIKTSRGEVKQIITPERTIYGVYYPPINEVAKDIGGKKDGTTERGQSPLPPVIITIHGGPTAMVTRGFNDTANAWNAVGFAVFEVDYTGSTGYGKAFRKALDGQWGRADVDDIIAAGHYLIAEKLADPEKLIIEGGSSGGYTALMALAKSDIFKCAACKYPVTDLGQLLDITHKFEAGYIYALTGTTRETAKEALASRSVLASLDGITAPVIFFQGLEDKVVPPIQPRTVHKALLAKGIRSEMLEFAGEGHGFRCQETVEAVEKAKYNFFLEEINK